MCVVGLSRPASAATLAVSNCNDAGPGSLRATVAAANPGDIITFALSPSCDVITLTSGDITIGTNLTIVGPGLNALAVSGDHVSNVFQIGTGVTANISGLTIEDGYAVGGGGGVYVGTIATLTLTDCTVADNVAPTGIQTDVGGPGKGGGIFVEGVLNLNLDPPMNGRSR